MAPACVAAGLSCVLPHSRATSVLSWRWADEVRSACHAKSRGAAGGQKAERTTSAKNASPFGALSGRTTRSSLPAVLRQRKEETQHALAREGENQDDSSVVVVVVVDVVLRLLLSLLLLLFLLLVLMLLCFVRRACASVCCCICGDGFFFFFPYGFLLGPSLVAIRPVDPAPVSRTSCRRKVSRDGWDRDPRATRYQVG